MAPAKVQKHPEESDAYLVTLTPKAVERLGIVTAPVETKSLPRRRTIAGEVMIPAGRTVVVSAPVAGTLEAPTGGEFPTPGQRIDIGREVFQLKPLLTPERDVLTPAERVQMANAKVGLVSAQIIAEGDLKSMQAEVDGAKIALDLATKLLEQRTGSKRDVQTATATFEIATQKRDAAAARKKALDALTLDETATGTLRTIAVTSPERGILQNVSAARGQMVTAGAVLLTVANLDRVWIRLPVYVGQVDEFDTKATCDVLGLDGQPLASPRTAEPIDAPPSADPLTSTVHLYYRVDNTDGTLLPGERVAIALPLRNDEAELPTVPWAAVLHDVHGTEWVYEQVEPNVFRRRRVLVKYVQNETAVLARGPAAGTNVVTDGVAELFGTEFGAGK